MMIRNEPWDLFRAVTRDLDRMFDDSASPRAVGRGWSPAVDIDEHDQGYELRFEVPGVRREDLHVEYLDGVLLVAGKRAESAPSGRRLRGESARGSFRRAFELPGVDGDAIEASYVDGVLTVRCPKVARARPKKIEVRAEPQTLQGQGTTAKEIPQQTEPTSH